jgi:hypothetical protein
MPKTEEALPSVRTPLDGATIVARLDAAARRGKLAGFAAGAGGAGAGGAGAGGGAEPLFCADAFGAYFDGVLEARYVPAKGAGGAGAARGAGGAGEATGGTLAFTLRLKPLMPWVWGAVMVATVWPGVLLMDSFLGMFPGSSAWWPTWWWYLPLTVPFVPWTMVVAVRKSKAAAREHALETIPRLAALLDGAVTEEGA